MQVRTWKESEQARGTHVLERAKGETSGDMEEREQPLGTHPLESKDGGTSENTEREGASEGHSPTGEHREWETSEGTKGK